MALPSRTAQAGVGAVCQDHERPCWASLRKPLEHQGRLTMLSSCSEWASDAGAAYVRDISRTHGLTARL
jgi:hypothetical protein